MNPWDRKLGLGEIVDLAVVGLAALLLRPERTRVLHILLVGPEEWFHLKCF